MNEYNPFHTVRPPVSTRSQCQRRSPQQGETPSYSFPLGALHKRILCLGENGPRMELGALQRHSNAHQPHSLAWIVHTHTHSTAWQLLRAAGLSISYWRARFTQATLFFLCLLIKTSDTWETDTHHRISADLIFLLHNRETAVCGRSPRPGTRGHTNTTQTRECVRKTKNKLHAHSQAQRPLKTLQMHPDWG